MFILLDFPFFEFITNFLNLKLDFSSRKFVGFFWFCLFVCFVMEWYLKLLLFFLLKSFWFLFSTSCSLKPAEVWGVIRYFWVLEPLFCKLSCSFPLSISLFSTVLPRQNAVVPWAAQFRASSLSSGPAAWNLRCHVSMEASGRIPIPRDVPSSGGWGYPTGLLSVQLQGLTMHLLRGCLLKGERYRRWSGKNKIDLPINCIFV